MKIYFCHSKVFDFKKELYLPVRESALNEEYDIIFPHETETTINSKETIKESDVIFAEVSFPATGMGIELGWADTFGKRIICFYRQGAHVSGSLKFISKDIIEYTNLKDLVEKMEKKLHSFEN